MPDPTNAQLPNLPSGKTAYDQAYSDFAATGATHGFDSGSYAAFKPKPGESYGDWVARMDNIVSKSDNGMWADTPFGGPGQGRMREFRDFIKSNAAKYQPLVNGGKLSADEQAAATQKQQEADFQTWRMNTLKRLDAFSQQMNMPVDQLIKSGDLGVMNAGKTGLSQASTAAYAAGLGQTGMSTMNTQRAVTDAQMKYQMGRQQLGLAATNDLSNQMGNMAHDAEDTRRYEQNMNLQLQGANQQAQQLRAAQNQSGWSTGLGIVGGVVGAYAGGPAGAAAGYQIGSGLGGSIGGSGYHPTGYTYPNGNSYGGSGGVGLGSGSSYSPSGGSTGYGGGGRNPYGGSQ